MTQIEPKYNSSRPASHYTVENLPLGWRHIRIVFVASLGQLIGTGVATLAGIIIPLLNIIHHPELSSALQGLIGAADLIGIVLGSVVLGRLSDRYGYLPFFRLGPLFMLGAAVLSIFVANVWVLIGCLFVIGFFIGGEYSLDSDYISELLPVRWRSTMIGIAKAASALGNVAVAGVCWWVVASWHTADDWASLMWIIAAIAGLMFLCRIRFWGSPAWLLAHGYREKAEKALHNFLGNDVELPSLSADSSNKSDNSPSQESLGSFVRKNMGKVILSGIPWACEGLGVYGIGIFLPILVMSLGLEPSAVTVSPIEHVASSVEITFWISCIILPGFILGIWLVSRKAYIPRLQWIGFWGCGVTLIVLLLAYQFHWATWISILAFMLFELLLNMGPHLVTYLLPPAIYPVADRGQGSGIAAAIGKIGAVLAVFIIPVLLKWGGVVLVLGVSAAIMAVGALVTMIYGPKIMPQDEKKV